MSRFSCLLLMAGIGIVTTTGLQPTRAFAQDLTASYTWKPVRLGAGGFVTGFITHPQNSAVRYCRTDVGNAYRWDNGNSVWVPMVVKGTSSGMPGGVSNAPTQYGVESIALDPNNTNVVYLSFQTTHSSDWVSLFPTTAGNVYKSTDGGVTFSAGNLSIPLSANDSWRVLGERMMVDPTNGNIVYYGSHSGLYRSTDSGSTWGQVTLNGSNVIGVQFSKPDGTASFNSQTVTKCIYAIVGDGSVYKSGDGGYNFNNISSGQGIDGKGSASTVDASGNLFVAQHNSTTIWKYHGNWSSSVVSFPNGQNLQAVTTNKGNASIVWAVGEGGALSRSSDGGSNWTPVSDHLLYGNTLAWLPQNYSWRSNGGITFDASGKLWIAEGNEGMLGYSPNNGEATSSQPYWAIDSKGIEEFVTHDAIVPPGGNLVVAVEDSTGLLVSDPNQFTAKQINLQDQLISNGTGLAYCPNAATYIAAVTADANYTGSGACYSGYSSDGGSTWTKFGSYPYNPELGKTLGTEGFGTIAVSRRNGWSLGGDHLVWLPGGSNAPYYSKDGGNSWTRTGTFPIVQASQVDGSTYHTWDIGHLKDLSGFWNLSLKQHQLVADPFVADKYYLKLTHGGLYVSTDGGVNWVSQSSANLTDYTNHGTLAANNAVQNDLWFADGWEGAYPTHGLWHSADGSTFNKISGIDYALALALGTGSGVSGAKPYTAYFYGKLTGNNTWGIFSSTDGGGSWSRIANYPTGIFDQPTCMAASWNTYGTVYVGTTGNSFVYGTTGSTGGGGGGTTGANVVINPSFDQEAYNTSTPTGWGGWQPAGQSGAAYTEPYGGTHTGARHYTHWNGQAYYVNSYQNISNLPNGTYTLSCWTKSSGGQNSVVMAIQGYGGNYVSTNIPASSSWTQVKITGINITNGSCQINLQSDAKASNWTYFDDVTLTKQ